ncbi:MAG: hypothetical protein KFW07_00470, partial [Mycoplasmataceae bacterium]|nr:hypothetical protein [Mycoplasmataceae bacterium]
YTPDDNSTGDPYSGSSHITSVVIAIRNEDGVFVDLKGKEIEDKIKQDSNGLAKISMTHSRKGSSPISSDGTDLSQFKGLKNGDIITVSFVPTSDEFVLPKRIEPLRIVVEGLFIQSPSDELFEYLRPNFSGRINGGGKFNIRVSNPNDPASTNESILGDNQWYEYQVWTIDKELKVSWTKDEDKIADLENGDKVEWKLVNRDGSLREDLYNTLKSGPNSFRVVQVIDGFEAEFRPGKGSSQIDNPDISGKPQYPELSGWLVSGLKTEIILNEEEKAFFEQNLKSFKPVFSGVDGLGEMYSNISNDNSISKNIVLTWMTTNSQGDESIITDFRRAGLSNGDKVWATIAPSQEAIEKDEIIALSNIMTSEVFIVSGLTPIVDSSSQTLLVALITTSSVLIVGLVGLIIFIRRNKKIGNNRGFKK